MEQKQFILAIDQICDEKGISKEKALEVVEASLASAYKKEYGEKGQIIKVNLDEVSGNIKVFQIKIVAEEIDETEIEENETTDNEEDQKKRFNPDRNITIEEAKKYQKKPQIDDEIEIPLPPHSDFGRIAAQTAKQVMIQKIREAEKEAIFNEFKKEEGEVVNGTVQRIEGKNIFVDVGKAVGILYPSEQVNGEYYKVGQKLKVYIIKIEEEAKEANLILSRTNPNIVEKLFEIEVPEIFSKAVEIKSIAREGGLRTKIAVHSNEEGIDPVGSCVGQRGARIQTIINELGGEKIDIIEWNKDIKKYIQHAIAHVDEDQLSLAIGKQGQNVRLAAKLTGWKIDIIGDKEKEVEGDENEKVEKEVGVEGDKENKE